MKKRVAWKRVPKMEDSVVTGRKGAIPDPVNTRLARDNTEWLHEIRELAPIAKL